VHLLAAAGVTASPLPAVATVALLSALAGSLVFHLRRHALLASPRSVVLVDLSDTLEAEVEERSGHRFAGSVLGSTFVAPWLMVIRFRLHGIRFPRNVVLMPDATDRETSRAARVWLRWRRFDPADR
jgi:toxin CptA